MRKYLIWDNLGASSTVEAENMKTAIILAQEWTCTRSFSSKRGVRIHLAELNDDGYMVDMRCDVLLIESGPIGYVDEFHVFIIDDVVGLHWYVATSTWVALQTHRVDLSGFDTADEYLASASDIKSKNVHWADEIAVFNDEGHGVTKTARQWAIEKRGLFCSIKV